MGCAQSRIENEESVSRCKERKILMKEAVVARNAFAAGHCGFAVALKNTGAALSDYAQGESEEAPQLHHHHHSHAQSLEPASQPPPPPPPPPMENLPPPPPLPNFSPSPSPQLKRAVTMPEIPMNLRKNPDSITIVEEDEEEEEEEDEGLRRTRKEKETKVSAAAAAVATASSSPRTPEMKSVPPMPEAKGMAWDYFFMVDNIPGSSLGTDGEDSRVENGDMDFGEDEEKIGRENMEVEPKTPEAAEETEGIKKKKNKVEETAVAKTTIEHSHTAPPDYRRVGKVAVARVSLVQVLSQIDDHFLKASEGAQEVSKMLEATRLHYHSNFADNRGI